MMIYAIAIGSGALLFAIGAVIVIWRIDHAREQAPFTGGPRHAATPPPRPQSPPTVAHLLPPPPAHSPDWEGTAYLPAPPVSGTHLHQEEYPGGCGECRRQAATMPAIEVSLTTGIRERHQGRGGTSPPPHRSPPPAWPDALVADAGGHHSVDGMLDSIVGRVDGLMVALAAAEERHG